jgi:uncharacterized membrane protein YeaQ/YmgE (transglycosylase-associated protein family)
MPSATRVLILKDRSSKFWAFCFISVPSLLVTNPAWAQTSNETAEGAGLLAWILVGLLGGYLASRVVNKRGEGLLRDIILGVIGGIIGGVIFRTFGGHGVTGFNLWSILVAFIGGVILLLIYHAIRRPVRA